MVWSASSLSMKRRTVQVVQDLAMLLGPDCLWDSRWIGVRPNVIVDADVAASPFPVGMLVKIVAFLDTVHWPTHAGNPGREVSLMQNFQLRMNFGQ